jgi:chromate reductase
VTARYPGGVIVVLSGSNRPRSRTRNVARVVVASLERLGRTVHLIDLEQLPSDLFVPTSYGNPPPSFKPYQDAVLAARGIVTVVPEYNGSYPGSLKYFIDLLKFPDSLRGLPSAFVGLAAGEWGGLRAVEHLQQVFQYRNANVYGKNVLVREVHKALDATSGALVDPRLAERLDLMLAGFVEFCRQVPPSPAAVAAQ